MNKSFTLAELAKHLGADLHGNPEMRISALAPLQSAESGQITFLDNPKYRSLLPLTKASAVILSADMLAKCPCAALIVPHPYAAYAAIATLFSHQPVIVPGIHPTAILGQACEIDDTVSIGPYVVLGDRVRIGKHAVIQAGTTIGDDVLIGTDAVIYPRVTIYHGCELGDHVVLHSGVVIGADGFGFAFHEGQYHKIPQIGIVQIGNHVEIGANTCIDRGALTNTIIGNGVKLDNQVQVAHNVEIGDHTVVAAGAGIAGSTKIGRYCRVGGLAGFAGHMSIVDNVTITAMSSVAQSINEPGIYSSGIPATPFGLWKRNMIRFQQLDELARRLMKLERQQNKKEENSPQ